jgi:UDP-galactopyranose mutase
VHIVEGAQDFIAACEKALRQKRSGSAFLHSADQQLAATSWDSTVAQMFDLIGVATQRNSIRQGKTIAAPRLRRKARFDYLIVGAGFAGSVLAERLTAASGKRVLLIDRRSHIAGNAYDHYDAAGILVHKYGPHIFHTNAPRVAAYLSRFTQWRPYEHRVLGQIGDKRLPIPINRTTINQLYGLRLTSDEEAAAFLESQADPLKEIRTAQDAVVSQVGWHLYRLFFEGYTSKQWGMSPTALDKSVTARVPARTSLDDRYFTDSFQAMPRMGYTHMFENMLDQSGLAIELGTDWREVKNEVDAEHTIFTGPIDEFFDWRYGPLPYRSISFRHCSLEQEYFQSTATVNYPAADVPWTRITEYKHLTGQVAPRTSITYEYPSAEGDPYYPIPKDENQALFKRYEALADQTADVTFVGRLATYRYYNMDQVVAQALATWKRLEPGRVAPATAVSSETARERIQA